MAKSDNVLVVFALEQEARDQFEEYNYVFTGVGKVNATYSLMDAMMQWYGEKDEWPELVINLGSAGSSHFPAGSIVNPTRFIQHDMDVTPLGFKSYETPFEQGIPVTLDHGMRLPEWPDAIIATGDHFVTKGMENAPWQLVDMEAYALAKVCLREQVPFACLKYISDGADGKAADTWEHVLDDCARKLGAALPQAIKTARLIRG